MQVLGDLECLSQHAGGCIAVSQHIAVVHGQRGGGGVGVPQHVECQFESVAGRRFGLGTHLRPLGDQFLILAISRVHGRALLFISLGDGER